MRFSEAFRDQLCAFGSLGISFIVDKKDFSLPFLEIKCPSGSRQEEWYSLHFKFNNVCYTTTQYAFMCHLLSKVNLNYLKQR